jgi:hypothetical protein
MTAGTGLFLWFIFVVLIPSLFFTAVVFIIQTCFYIYKAWQHFEGSNEDFRNDQ